MIDDDYCAAEQLLCCECISKLREKIDVAKNIKKPSAGHASYCHCEMCEPKEQP